MKFRNKKKFQYGLPAYTGTFRALGLSKLLNEQLHNLYSSPNNFVKVMVYEMGEHVARISA
jgi:hypothetical protein